MKLFKLVSFIHISIQIALSKLAKSFSSEKQNELASFKSNHYNQKWISLYSVDILSFTHSGILS